MFSHKVVSLLLAVLMLMTQVNSVYAQESAVRPPRTVAQARPVLISDPPSAFVADLPPVLLDELTGEYYFMLPHDVRVTLVSGQAGTIRLSHPDFEEVLYVKLQTVMDLEAKTATQFVTVESQDGTVINRFSLQHSIAIDQDSGETTGSIKIVDLTAGQSVMANFNSQSRRLTVGLAERTADIYVVEDLYLPADRPDNDSRWLAGLWGWITGTAAGTVVVGGAAVVGVVALGAAGAYSGLVGPYDCSGYWDHYWNGCE